MNQLQLLRFADGAYAEALIDEKRAVELAPDIDTYRWNLSVAYKYLQRYSEAADSAMDFVQRAKEIKQHHLKHIKEVMEKAGRLQELEERLASLSVEA